jgi:hypothetical protein
MMKMRTLVKILDFILIIIRVLLNSMLEHRSVWFCL